MTDLWNEEVYCESCKDTHTHAVWYYLGMNCGRCGKHTGNNSQGHYWGLCKAWLAMGVDFKNAVREPHFCCPDDCELEK